jgi:hypothetical protein
MNNWGSSIWDSVKKGADAAADALKNGAEIAGQYTEKAVNETGRMAHKARLQAEIALLQDRIATVKKRWGEKSYDAMVSGDMATVNRHLDVAKAEMESLMLEMAEKRSELAAVEIGEHASSSPDYSTAAAGPSVPVPTAFAEPPSEVFPPPPPPMAAYAAPVVEGAVPAAIEVPVAVPVGDPLAAPPSAPPPLPPSSSPAADEPASTEAV